MNIGLVACAALKQSEAAPARELYVSPLFKKASAYAEATYCRWAILSAKHGFVWPYTVIEPYDETLNDMTTLQRRAWAERVYASLPTGDVRFFLHAGKYYSEWLARWLHADLPLAGLGIGQQLAWYKARGF